MASNEYQWVCGLCLWCVVRARMRMVIDKYFCACEWCVVVFVYMVSHVYAVCSIWWML